MRSRRESGQATPLAAALVAIAAILTIALGTMARDVVDAARAQTAADAAALASIEGGRPAATRLAARHDGSVVAWSQRGHGSQVTVTVAVRVGEAVAVARATGGEVSPDDG